MQYRCDCPFRQNYEVRQKHSLCFGGENIFPEHEEPKQKEVTLWRAILHWRFPPSLTSSSFSCCELLLLIKVKYLTLLQCGLILAACGGKFEWFQASESLWSIAAKKTRWTVSTSRCLWLSVKTEADVGAGDFLPKKTKQNRMVFVFLNVCKSFISKHWIQVLKTLSYFYSLWHIMQTVLSFCRQKPKCFAI